MYHVVTTSSNKFEEEKIFDFYLQNDTFFIGHMTFRFGFIKFYNKKRLHILRPRLNNKQMKSKQTSLPPPVKPESIFHEVLIFKCGNLYLSVFCRHKCNTLSRGTKLVHSFLVRNVTVRSQKQIYWATIFLLFRCMVSPFFANEMVGSNQGTRVTSILSPNQIQRGVTNKKT